MQKLTFECTFTDEDFEALNQKARQAEMDIEDLQHYLYRQLDRAIDALKIVDQERFRAATQYGDYKGTCAMDGYSTDILALRPLAVLSGVTGTIIGFDLSQYERNDYQREHEDRTDFENVYVIYVDESIGDNIDGVQQWIREHPGESLPVKRQEIKAKFTDIFDMMKRIEIVASYKRILDDIGIEIIDESFLE